MQNKTLIFKSIPTDFPVPGEHLVIEDRPLDLDTALDSCTTGKGIVVKAHYSSYDPYLRTRMRDASIKSYMPAFDLGGPIVNTCVGTVVRSQDTSSSATYAVDDLVSVFGPIAEYVVIPDPSAAMARKLPKDFLSSTVASSTSIESATKQHAPALFLGPLGMPGITAYSGLHRIGKPKAGETVFVSSAAGAVGQVVGAVAKHLGCRVVGSVGSDAKLQFILKDLGPGSCFDDGFNYKTESPSEALPRIAPEGIDIYFDNVGGEHLEAALDCMKTGGRVPVCGMISGYNQPASERHGVKNLFTLVAKLITMQGFLQGQPEFGAAYFDEFQANVQAWIADGSFTPKLAVTEGIDNAAEGFVGMLKGDNFGKAVVKI